MKKKLITMAVASAFAGVSSMAMAGAAVSTSGYVDVIYAISDESGDPVPPATKNSKEGKFHTAAEVDVTATNGAVSTRVDVDLEGNSGSGGADLEQAYFGWQINDTVNLMAGAFNNPVGLEAEDAPDMWSINHGLIYKLMADGADTQGGGLTDRNGNNVEGVVVGFAAGPADITIGLLNETTSVADEEESVLFQISSDEIIPGLSGKLSVLTVMDSTTTAPALPNSVESVTDLNLVYKIGDGHVGFEYVTASELLDAAYSIQGGWSFGDFGVFARFDTVEWDITGAEDDEQTTISFSWEAAENLHILLENTSNEYGSAPAVIDVSKTEIELLATF